MAQRQGPLNWKVPIVNKDGTPTPEFIRKWQAQNSINGTIPNLNTVALVSAVLDVIGDTVGDLLVRGSTVWEALAPGTANRVLVDNGVGNTPSYVGLSALFDAVFGNTHGNFLQRDATGWESLAPPTGHNGYALTWDDVHSKLVWAAGGSGGGGVVIGAGAPTSLQAAGTIYSRNDVAEIYGSTPTTAGGSVVQSYSSIQGNNVPGSVVLPTTPTPGNLIICYVAWGNTQAAPTINTASWTLFATAPNPSGGTTIAGFAVYRYVQVGDTSVLPALCSAGSSYWAGQFWEVSGVSGTFATDVPVIATHQAFGNAHNAGPITTTVAGQLALVCGGQYDATVNPTNSTSGWTLDSAANNGSNFGNMGGWHQTVSASGTAISAALSSNAGSSYCFSGIIIAITVTTTTSPGWTKVGSVPGGTTGQVLTKISGADGDYHWATAGGGGGGYSPGAPPGMVQFAYSGSSVASATFAAAPTNGNLLVAICANGPTNSPGTGWTILTQNTGGYDYGLILYKVAGASEPVTQSPINGTGTGGMVCIWELSGANATQPFVWANCQGEQSGLPYTEVPILTAIPPNCICLSALALVIGQTINKAYNLGNQDALDNTGQRCVAAGHATLGDLPQGGVMATFNAAGQYKIGTVLVGA